MARAQAMDAFGVVQTLAIGSGAQDAAPAVTTPPRTHPPWLTVPSLYVVVSHRSACSDEG